MKLLNKILILLGYIMIFDIGIASMALFHGIFGIVFGIVIMSYLCKKLKEVTRRMKLEGKL